MKHLATALGLLLSTALLAQNGYEIKVTLKPFKNQYIYLGHYSGKQLPIIDSVKLDAASTGVFRGAKKLGGGIYLVGYPDRSNKFEMLQWWPIRPRWKKSVLPALPKTPPLRHTRSL
jgi:hypothetical protein